MIQNWLSYWML